MENKLTDLFFWCWTNSIILFDICDQQQKLVGGLESVCGMLNRYRGNLYSFARSTWILLIFKIHNNNSNDSIFNTQSWKEKKKI